MRGGRIAWQFKTIAAGSVVIGLITAILSPHSIFNVPFDIGIVSIAIGVAVWFGF